MLPTILLLAYNHHRPNLSRDPCHLSLVLNHISFVDSVDRGVQVQLPGHRRYVVIAVPWPDLWPTIG